MVLLAFLCVFSGPLVSVSSGKVIKKIGSQGLNLILVNQTLRSLAKESIFSIKLLADIIFFMGNHIPHWLS